MKNTKNITKRRRRELKSVRRRLKLTFKQVAEEMGVDQSTVFRLESGEIASPTVPTIRAWESAMTALGSKEVKS